MLAAEADWVCLFFKNRRDIWRARGTGTTPGYASYALKQADMWETFIHIAEETVVAMGAEKERQIRRSSK